MTTYPREPALEAAVVANADEDTPRLVYADWLDEHGDPLRAEFIRVQCRLANGSPADTDWVDLLERQDELIALFQYRLLRQLDQWRPDQKDFYFPHDPLDSPGSYYRRGFPYFIDYQNTDIIPGDTQAVRNILPALTNLVRTTTIRGFHPYYLGSGGLAELLAKPVAGQLTGLAFSPRPISSDWGAEVTEVYRLLARSPVLARLRSLELPADAPETAIAELTVTDALPSLRDFSLPHVDGSKSTREQLVETRWFQGLRHFGIVNSGRLGVGEIVAAGLGRLPSLHTLYLPELGPKALTALTSGAFPALGSLCYSGSSETESLSPFARVGFPNLCEFSSHGELRSDGLKALLRADWFARLRVLNLMKNEIGDRGIQALAAHPVAKSLRILCLGGNAFGRLGLLALAAPGAFSELTTLSLASGHKRKATPADLTAFLSAFRGPRLRHLNLTGWPLGDNGAKALAANSSLANLTRLTVDSCGIGDAGAAALFSSPYMQQLIELSMDRNPIRTGADALADPAVMPRLAVCRLSLPQLPDAMKARFQRDGLYLIL